MAFLKRLSNSLWDYVSPSKPSLPTPKTAAVDATGLTPIRKTSIDHVVKHAQSMSPTEKIKGWPVQTPTSSLVGTKRRLSDASSLGAGRPIKQPKLKMEDLSERYSHQSLGEDVDVDMEDESEGEDEDDLSPFGKSIRYDSASVGDTVVVSEDALQVKGPKFVSVDAATYLAENHSTTQELRAKGWDDDLITLYQKILLRGHEPVLPHFLKMEYRWWPDAFFEDDDDAFIGSMRGQQFRAGVALRKILDIGGYARDTCLMVEEGLSDFALPEMQVSRLFNAYLRWAEADAELDTNTAIPILTQVYEPQGTEGDYLMALAKGQCQDLTTRWKQALQVSHSVEMSPSSSSKMSDGTILCYELPTLYALIASYTIVGIMAYRPDTDELLPLFQFDFGDRDTSVYTSLALAMLACHVRNVEARIAEETMIGLKQPNSESEEEDDPDA